jgi:hypothetical protein
VPERQRLRDHILEFMDVNVNNSRGSSYEMVGQSISIGGVGVNLNRAM